LAYSFTTRECISIKGYSIEDADQIYIEYVVLSAIRASISDGIWPLIGVAVVWGGGWKFGPNSLSARSIM
jgi:hypothetical protein